MLIFRQLFLGLSLFTLAGTSLAAPITLNGDHFTVTYDSVQAGLYNQGFLAGSLDTVYFQPNTFSALSGGSPASTQASLELTVSIDSGYSFAGLNFTERGDYFMIGNVAVNVAAGIEAVNADTSASALLSLAPGSPLAQTGASTPWQLTGSLSPLALGAPQTLVVTLDNTLFASASAGSLGFIQKTYAGFQIVTQPVSVPEPSGLALLLVGGMAAVLVGRRRMSIPGTRL